MPRNAVPGGQDPSVTDEGPSAVPPLDVTPAIAIRKSGLKNQSKRKMRNRG